MDPDRNTPKPQIFTPDDAPTVSVQEAPADFDMHPDGQSRAEAAIRLAAEPRRRSAIGRLFWWSLTGFIALMLGLAAFDTVSTLIARNAWMGRAALGLMALMGLALLLMVLRELAALGRIAKVQSIRTNAERAWRQDDVDAARIAERDLARLYAGRADMKWARDEAKEQLAGQFDADGLMTSLERSYMGALDKEAQKAVARASRLVATSTAIIPVGLLDAIAVLYLNVRMIREVAQIYDGRAGWIGSWRLFKRVAVHLLATGAVAIGEDLLGPLLGGSAMSRLSRRFGEGVINGVLTARVGVAAIEVCRPLPFEALKRPSVRAISAEALKGIIPGSRKPAA